MSSVARGSSWREAGGQREGKGGEENQLFISVSNMNVHLPTISKKMTINDCCAQLAHNTHKPLSWNLQRLTARNWFYWTNRLRRMVIVGWCCCCWQWMPSGPQGLAESGVWRTQK